MSRGAMLAQQEWQDANRKRGREDDYQDIAAGGTLGFTEHRSKRMQALPLRISEAPKRWPAPTNLPTGHHNIFGQQGPHAVTPSNSDSDDADAGARNQLQYQTQHPNQQQACQPSPPTYHMEPELNPGEDMDMTMDTPEQTQTEGSVEEQHGDHLHPGSLQPDPIGPPTITGRMPTPIQPSFAAQVRGGSKNWSGAAGNIMGTPPPQQIHHSAFSNHGSQAHESQHGMTSSAAGGMADWSQVQNRRLPSPISEGGGEADSSQNSFSMAMDSSGGLDSYHGHQRGTILRTSSAIEMGGSAPAVSLPPRSGTPHVIVTEGDGSMDVEAASPSPPRKGHSRSRHTVNNWTQQPGMKKSFSIGYRSDCEKCRLKVPGHFNHIIIS